MSFNTIEMFAVILIAIGVIKIIVILISPKSWLNFAKTIYANPKVTSFVALILSLIVLYYLVNAGITIVQILAVTLFVALLISAGIARYSKNIIGSLKNKDLRELAKEYWLYSLIWTLLLIWGIKELFFP